MNDTIALIRFIIRRIHIILFRFYRDYKLVRVRHELFKTLKMLCLYLLTRIVYTPYKGGSRMWPQGLDARHAGGRHRGWRWTDPRTRPPGKQNYGRRHVLDSRPSIRLILYEANMSTDYEKQSLIKIYFNNDSESKMAAKIDPLHFIST